MATFLGYFIWGLILAAPLAWLTWRLDLLRWLPRWTAPRPRRAVRLPPQLDALVIRGKRQSGGGRR
ncbi:MULTISPECIES: hypothetical protein [unclassified Cupriavidus]|jgi:hypothetical protein|uniref:hypothetical protein n=1 Tax=unclassified Cupriavidus TaxID=2640874 RepID=UPI001C005262|nr:MULTISPECIES: hypothetical protein [unclassified Cupriavidus]MCA3185582.1 hypothetical protein [Cupriavidus sp.]MCA3194237.1 hypothetical protein [Cupriavidus sp.]MCA3198125.1 hypothetical protein [Cupriavidus sp.]MCA3205531.1 hypothetical protein [Cupriavidus sp.]MCA3209224.1 hypothetical protein [Cupriavidus sp.]